MKIHIGVLGLLAGVAALASASPAAAQAPDRVTIDRITYFGTGCPAGTADVDVIDDRTAFLVTYRRFQAQAGPGVPLTQTSKACTLTIFLNYPAGWTYSVASVVYRGNVSLGPGTLANLRFRYSFPGHPSVLQDLNLVGPRLGDFETRRALEQQAWAPCGGSVLPMTIAANGRVNNTAAPSRTALLTVEQTDGTFKVILNLSWQRC
ncbi:DUF4360 domain-containing protein [Sorangium sp. So ce1036]|uniref:DUF4360 domain-containing protein n=1 Tax=Sorangium sp. So ce1036 TaxID=3133328 RepID=UPI003F08DE01